MTGEQVCAWIGIGFMAMMCLAVLIGSRLKVTSTSDQGVEEAAEFLLSIGYDKEDAINRALLARKNLPDADVSKLINEAVRL